MSPVFRNVLEVIAGALIGGVVNMGIIMISGTIIPPPDGADVTTMEGLKASIHLFEPKHFVMPFLAHALGTLTGALLTFIIALSNKLKLAMVIGLFFLLGGITNAIMLPSPIWFIIIDLVFAYFPMAWFGAKLTSGITRD